MNLVTTLVGIAHGLIFVPVILAYFGPTVNKALLFERQEKEAQQAAVNQSLKLKDKNFEKKEKMIPEPVKVSQENETDF